MTKKKSFFKNYALSIILIAAIAMGSLLGVVFKERSVVFKPFGDVFLNLLFTVVVPLVFFSISSAVASMGETKRLKRIFTAMMAVFILTGIVSSVLMIVGVKIFPPVGQVTLDASFEMTTPAEDSNLTQKLVAAFTVSDFAELFSRKNMLALIVFALLVGLAALLCKDKAKPFSDFLAAGNEVMLRVVRIIMLYAPVGLGAYFAYLVGVFGPKLLGSYARAMTLYYPLALLYFFGGFSLYAYFAGGKRGVRTFWSNIIPTSLTAFGTGSSVATIPVNLEAAEKIGIPEDIREVVIPVGATIHMDGSCLSAVLKIAVLFGLFGMDFSGPGVFLMAVGVALLSGIVMSGIPGGGFLGEMMIVTLYGFPPEALPVISMIGTLVDPPATMVNAVGDNVAGMMIARILGGKQWIEKKQ